MRKWKQLFALGISVTAISFTCSGCEKVVQGVVAEAEEAGTLQEDKATAGKMTIKEMVDIPDRYKTVVTYDENIHINADASISIPEVDEIQLKKVTQVNYELDDYLKIINSLADQTVTQEDMTVYSEGHYVEGSFTICGLPYHFCVNTCLDGENDVLNTCNISLADDRLIEDEEGTGIYNSETGECLCEYQEITGQEYLKQAETLLQRCGFTDYRPADGELEVLDSNRNVVIDELSAEGKGAAAFIHCERVVNQVPITWINDSCLDMYRADSVSNVAELNIWRQEELSINYYNNTLISLDFNYPLEISGYSDEKQFLLPFSEIRGIFEEMLGWRITHPTNGGSVAWDMTENGEVSRPVTWATLVGYNSVEVDVSKVQLGYMRVREEEVLEEGNMEGLLIPVWDFIGTWRAKIPGEDGTTQEYTMAETSLLTLDARDGSVIKRMFGY